MAPHTPQRSARPGGAVARLGRPVSFGRRHTRWAALTRVSGRRHTRPPSAAPLQPCYAVLRYSASCLRTKRRERWTRDFTAGRLIPSVSAISGFDTPSTSCRTSAVRYSAGSLSIALSQDVAQLALQRLLVHAIGPVVHRLEVPALAVEHGQHVVHRDLVGLLPARPQLLIRRVGGDPIDPRAERRLALEHVDLARGRPQRVLGRLFRVLVGPGDPHGQPIDPVTEAIDELLGGAGLFAPERLDQAGVHIHPRTRHDSHDRTS